MSPGLEIPLLSLMIRINDRRNQLTLREGEQRRGYRVGKYRSVRDSKHPDRSALDHYHSLHEQVLCYVVKICGGHHV